MESSRPSRGEGSAGKASFSGVRKEIGTLKDGEKSGTDERRSPIKWVKKEFVIEGKRG